ncbi:phosphatidylglycerophosphate synthase [Litorimonas taeanensis]|uniref:Phosphatidylglycerophosphate synthase n=1 Tax=Litorimonas taeanensis TaxID=568099 RepID=A0A420WJQ7_9PROT|nr:CDP-alcohol phosphatidyltransferase family protein [Litorimonas taeanensis]RKQ71250.1 phosphatidylglycerophosphate synthase [Litorimonas taeanensis]
MPQEEMITPKQAGGAFADGLTLIRLLTTPVIMALIYFYWPETKMAVLISVLFIIAALTDIFDDYFGGSSRSVNRKFGWVDDAADTTLVVGTLIALLVVIYQEGILAWPFALPAGIIIIREIVIGLTRGFEISRLGWNDSKLGNAKSGLSMLAVCILVASPWLTQAIDKYRAGADNAMDVFNAASPWVWGTGQAVLWVAALLSVISAINILKTPRRVGVLSQGESE